MNKELDDIFEHLLLLPDIPKNVRGKEYKAECPCGGTLVAWRVKPNGHLRVKCDKCGFKLME